MKLKRTIAGLLIAVGLCILTGGCHSRNVSPGTGAAPVAAVQTTQTSLVGQWHQVQNGFPGATMFAVISIDSIEINLQMQENGDGLTGIYWQGSFNPTLAGVQTSKVDVNAMADSLLASEDPTKSFTYDGTDITYSFSMLGVTTTVVLARGAS
jgi:hypothetical protein